MRYATAALLRNLGAGLRLALFLPVERLRFRVDAVQLLLLVLVSALVDVGADWLRYGPDAGVSFGAVGGELAATALILLVGALLAAWTRDRDVLLALPVMGLAAFVPLQLVNAAIDVVPDAAVPLGDAGAELVHWGLVAWVFAVLVRIAALAQPKPSRRAARTLTAAALLALPLLLPAGIFPSAPWFEPVDDAPPDGMSAASEPVLALQRQLQDDALAKLEDHDAGTTDLYFIAFAPDGAGETWHDRIEAAVRVMEGHWGASGRTLAYVNDPRRIGDEPIASVTHLREALAEVAGASDADEDVLMLYVAGRSNRDGSLRVSVPGLDLVQLSAPGLRSLLDEAGFRWRVVVLAVCTPSPFIAALADENTVVIANGSGDADVAECGRRGEPTSFGDAFFGEAMPRATSIAAAVDAAKARLQAAGAGREPFLHIGSAIAPKLDAVRGRAGGMTAWNRVRDRE